MGPTHQRLVRMARLLAEGKSRDYVCAELEITKSTFYRDRSSDDYAAIVDGLKSVTVPRDHPDVVAAQNIAAASQLSIATIVAEGARITLDALMKRVRAVEDGLSDRDLISTVKIMLDAHREYVTVEGVEEAELTEADIEEGRRLLGMNA